MRKLKIEGDRLAISREGLKPNERTGIYVTCPMGNGLCVTTCAFYYEHNKAASCSLPANEIQIGEIVED